MGLVHVRQALRDVPGVEDLAMDMKGGDVVYTIAGHEITLPATVSDADAAAAIRATVTDSAARPQPASPTPMTEPTAAVLPAVAIAPAPPPAAAVTPVDAAHTVKGMLAEHVALMGQIHAAQLEILRAALADQRNSVSGAITNVAGKIKGQTDDFKAIMGQFTNQLDNF